MRYISIFSGVEAATLAWEPMGWEPVAFAEVDPFPSAVLSYRWPDVPNLGDVTKIDWSPYRGTVDLVVGGSPCQSYSIAGNREGLLDERGRLMFEYVRAIREVNPEWLIWENVPGVLSQDRGKAFGTLLTELDELGYGLAWRVLDAQYVRVANRDGEGRITGWVGPVAQRRRRVFLVGCSGNRCNAAAAVLFERESVSRAAQAYPNEEPTVSSEADRRAGSAGKECDEPYVMASTHYRAELGPVGKAPALMAHNEKQPPVLFPSKTEDGGTHG